MNDADRIKQGRLALGDTQLALAERLGVTVKTVNNWENGRYKPTARIRGLLNRIFNFHIGKQKGKPLNVKIKNKKGSKFNINDVFYKTDVDDI